ncbi:MAG: acyl-CoA thioesterase [Hyphomicrobiales bacterium]|jgi:4-hydroxybenzoyl-CoA thioesterase|nr:MAG: acyl-CoA thioesterase [Hyphomicrobiales bacterium]
MLKNVHRIRIEWGDCDPAGIVFYPRYFEWFDRCTHHLFEAATGMIKKDMLEKYGGAGIALLEARAEFKMSSHYGEDIDVESEVVEFRRSSFFLEHRVTKKGEPMLKGYETRLWTVRHPEDPARLKSAPMPTEIIAAFQRDTPPR